MPPRPAGGGAACAGAGVVVCGAAGGACAPMNAVPAKSAAAETMPITTDRSSRRTDNSWTGDRARMGSEWRVYADLGALHQLSPLSELQSPSRRTVHLRCGPRVHGCWKIGRAHV